MKTFFVVYTPFKLTAKDAFQLKRYSFNTKFDKVAVGDTFVSPDYSTGMQVVEVLPKSYKYVDFATGKLSNKITNTNQRPMKEINFMMREGWLKRKPLEVDALLIECGEVE